MSIRSTVLAATLASLGSLASLGAAHADGVQPLQAASIDLGNVSGVAYYTVESGNFHVITTLVQGETGTPVRVVADLAPGQSIVLSASGEAGSDPAAVEISRQDDRLLVREAVVTN